MSELLFYCSSLIADNKKTPKEISLGAVIAEFFELCWIIYYL